MKRQTEEAAVEIVDVTKRFGNVVAVRNFSLRVQRGELVTLLGPSGCGKTTTLHIVAGFEHLAIIGDSLARKGVRSGKRIEYLLFQNVPRR